MCVSSDTDLGPSEEGSAGVAGGGPVVLAQLGGLEVAHAALGHHPPPRCSGHHSPLVCSHDCQGSSLVFCSGQYGHQFPFDNDLMAGTRIMWDFMKLHNSSQ